MKLAITGVLALCALASAQPTVATSSPKEDLAKCETKQVISTFFGKVSKTACDDCTTTTFLTGKGPAYCAKYKDYVSSTTARQKVVINGVAGFLPGAFDKIPAGASWIEIGVRTGSGVSTFSTLPDGIFDKCPAASTIRDIDMASTSAITFKNPERIFSVPMPAIKSMQLNFPADKPLVGFGPKLFSKNIANLSRLQVYFGNDAIPNGTLANLPELRQVNLVSAILKALPADVFKAQKKAKGIYLSGGGVDKDGRYVPMPITVLPPGIFANNPNLNELQVRGSLVSELPTDLFAKNPKIAMVIFMDSNLKTLPANLLTSNKNIYQLSLYNNNIAKLPANFFPTDRRVVLYFTPQTTGATCKSLAPPKNIECY